MHAYSCWPKDATRTPELVRCVEIAFLILHHHNCRIIHFRVFQAEFSMNTVIFKIYCRHILNKPRKSQYHMLNCVFAIILVGCRNPFNVLYCISFNKQRKHDVFWVLIIAKSLVEVELKWVSKIKVKQYDKRDRVIKRMWGTGSEFHLYRTEIDRIKILLLKKHNSSRYERKNKPHFMSGD